MPFTVMSTPSAQEVIDAFARIMRKKLENGDTVEVPGLGTFSIEHEPSQMKENADGESYMAPPRDVVAFDPDQ
jgi:nucleoid DNA-binding protein